MKDSKEIFESYPVPRAAMSMAVPTMLSMLVTILYNMADTFFIGQTNDPNQVAAVSAATPVFLLLMACGNIFGVGGSAFISRTLGEGKEDKVKRISSFCFYGCIAVGMIMMCIFLFGMNFIVRIVGCDSHTIGYTKEYLYYISYGSVFVVLSTAFGNIIRGEGAAKASMFGMILGTVVNIVLDPIMILTMNLGVRGAAIATVIGNICTVLFYGVYLWKSNTRLSVQPRYFAIGEGILAGVLLIGIPASFNNLLMSLSNILLNRYLYSYGTSQVAAMGVASKANLLVILLQMGVAMGIQPLVGYNFGCRNFNRLKQFIKFGSSVTIVIGAVLSVFYYVFARQVVGVFIHDQEVIHYGIIMLRALMVSGPFIGILFMFSFSFQGMGKAAQALVLSVSRQGFVFFPVLVIASKIIGLEGIIYAQPIADMVSLILAFIMFLGIKKSFEGVKKAA